MAVAPKHQKIDDLMDKASAALGRTAYFEAERMGAKALTMARQENDFERMARIVMPLQEARRQRLQQALDAGAVTVIDTEITEEMKIEPGCYLIRPPLVGADARRFRLAALHREIPVAVICREPTTSLGLCPIVAIGPNGSIRTKIDPPEDPDHPTVAWLVAALEELGDFAIRTLDSDLAPTRRVDALLDRLDAVPEHEGMHQALDEACRAAFKAAAAERAKSAEGSEESPST